MNNILNFESNQKGFQLPNFVQENLSNLECAENIANFFSRVSQEYQPLNVNNLPPNIQEYLGNPVLNTAPELSNFDVFEKLVKAKKPKSSVPGDLPRKLTQQFPFELAIPVTKMFNKISNSKDYPEQWKIERQIPIPKINPPKSESSEQGLRILCC